MSGRRVYFSFHYDADIWRAANVRKTGAFDAVARVGWNDASIWEEAKRKGDTAIRNLIDGALKGTSVTAVLIGEKTATRPWVKYEIEKSIERGNGLLGVRIHNVKDRLGKTSSQGLAPQALSDGNYHTYEWKASKFGDWVERSALAAGKPCLKHHTKGCWQCKLAIWWRLS